MPAATYLPKVVLKFTDSGDTFSCKCLDTYLMYSLLALSGDLLVYSFEVREDSEGNLW